MSQWLKEEDVTELSFVSLGNLEELEAPGPDPNHSVRESEKDNETLCSNSRSLRING